MFTFPAAWCGGRSGRGGAHGGRDGYATCCSSGIPLTLIEAAALYRNFSGWPPPPRCPRRASATIYTARCWRTVSA